MNRRNDIHQSISAEQDLLKEIEDEIRTATDPRTRLRLERDAERVRSTLSELHQELDVIRRQSRLTGRQQERTDELQEYLLLLDWEILEKPAVLNTGEFEFVIEKQEGVLFRRVLVHFTTDEVDLACLSRLVHAKERRRIPLGWLIAESRIDPRAMEKRSRDFASEIEVQSLRDVLLKLIRADAYFNWLKDTHEQLRIESLYVDLGCERVSLDIAPGGREMLTTHHPLIDKYVDEWLEGGGQNQLSILGAFGTGKTWFCWNYANKQLDRFLRDPVNQRIPLLISLRDYRTSEDVEQMFTRFFARFDSGLEKYPTLDKLNRLGRLLIVFDGFDEMALGKTHKSKFELFRELAEMVHPDSKVILTSRVNYFPIDLEEFDILSRPDTDEFDQLPFPYRPNFEIVRLLEWNESQAKEYLQKRVPANWKDYWSKIQSTHDLPGLAKKPVMLDMISETLPQLQYMPSIDSFTLYDTYVMGWIQKKMQKRQADPDIYEVRQHLELIAWELYETGNYEISYQDLPESIGNLFELNQHSELGPFDSDVRGQRLLVRSNEGYYFFAHRSFLEFFTASRILGCLKEDDSSCVSINQRSDEVLHFLSQSGLDQEEKLLSRLVQWAADGNRACRWNATALFTRLKNPYLITEILSDEPRIWSNAEVIWSLGERVVRDRSLYDERVVEFLWRRVRDSSVESPWWNTAFALKSILGVDPIEILIENLDDPKWTVDYALEHFDDRRAVVGVLKTVRMGALSADSAANMIVSEWPRLKTNPDAAYNVLWILGPLKSTEGIMVLTEAAKDSSFPIRNRVAEALGAIGSVKGIPILLQLLENDEHYRVRRYAAESLGKIGDPNVIPKLESALEKEWNLDVRTMIEAVLEKLYSKGATA